MASTSKVSETVCPNCKTDEYVFWGEERGFSTVRCSECRLLYVNPRPNPELIHEAVKTGAHSAEADGLVVTARHAPGKVEFYRRHLGAIFQDVWRAGKPVSWVDVGAGYGEVIEAVSSIAPAGSYVEGLEPMRPKANAARARGLNIVEDYLQPNHPKADIISVVNVFSHIPEFDEFLSLVRSVLKPNGQLFIETGNLADMERRSDFPGELGLPDHLVFAGEPQLRQFLDRGGFDVVKIRKVKTDGFIPFIKNVVKRLIGRPVVLRMPYTSAYRSLLIRAQLRQ
ncbi:class I SAM-dependent methyltransferase [Allosphingosinicella sp.]|uniref:class I SAM-dependent methyltransferase n=1 Tax=Allosphingosinicella sp. TaxID=2823234 RepID=UPI002FC1CED9